MLPFRAMQHNIRSGLSCLHEQGISYIVLYGGYAAPNRLEETVRWHGSEHSRVVHFEQARKRL